MQFKMHLIDHHHTREELNKILKEKKILTLEEGEVDTEVGAGVEPTKEDQVQEIHIKEEVIMMVIDLT